MAATPVTPIPELRGTTLLGVAREFRRDPLAFLEDVRAQHGDIVRMRFGPRWGYLFNTPETVKELLVDKAGFFHKGMVLQRSKPVLGEGLLTSEGQFHLRQRRLIQPAFHREKIAHYAQIMAEQSVRTAQRWQAGEVVDLSQEMMRLTLAIVGQTLFRADVENDAPEVGRALTELFKTFEQMLRPSYFFRNLLPLPDTLRRRRSIRQLDDIIYRIIGERRAESGSEDADDLLSLLIRAQEGEYSMTDKQVRDEALTLFLAGHETTAVALSWTWFLLDRNPHIREELEAELDRALQADPTFDDVPRLPYTEMVIAESMRLHPPAWAIGRMAIAPCQIGNAPVKKGEIAVVSPALMHRRPDLFPEPLRFDPRRWTPEAKETRPRYSYFPFGGGARICVGERFAWMEAVIALATLARHWRCEILDPEQVEPNCLITMRMKRPLRARLTRRPA